jgi:protein-disulfide isomerase
MVMSTESTANESRDLKVEVSPRDHVQGSPSAPVVLVEYGDYECPDCLNAWPIVQELQRTFGPKLAFVFRHYPQSSIHPHASAAAQAAEAAGAQGKFWEMHDLLFSHQHDLDSLDLTHLGLQLGLEVYRFQSALEDEKLARKVRDDFTGGQLSGVPGTPTFFLNGQRYRGRRDAESMGSEIRSMLTKA